MGGFVHIMIAFACCISLGRCNAQANSVKPEFDVASVRQNKSDQEPQRSNVPLGPGNIYTPTHGVFSAHNFPLTTYILFAYRMTDGQWQSFRSQLPKWALDDRFDIEARTDNQSVSKDDLRLMMRALLADRFGFTVHTEWRTTSVFALTVITSGETGPRLRPHPSADPCNKETSTKSPETLPGGFPVICGGILRLDNGGTSRITLGGRGMTMRSLADTFEGWGQLKRPVVDTTGLAGEYDFVLEFKPLLMTDAAASESPNDDAGATFQEAIKQQLGLRLQPRQMAFDFLVLDRIERLSEN